VKRRKKLASHARVRPPAAARVNDCWSMDFVADSLSNGGKIRVLTVIDSFTRECLALKIARSLPSRSVTEELDQVIAKRGAPQTIQVDNGTEFTSNHFDAWAYFRGIDFTRPGKPVDNAHIESFNGRLRDECLNSRWFESVDDAAPSPAGLAQRLQRSETALLAGGSTAGGVCSADSGPCPGAVFTRLRRRHQAGPTKGAGSMLSPCLDPNNLAGSI
jgi:transposase InsO family protein